MLAVTIGWFSAFLAVNYVVAVTSDGQMAALASKVPVMDAGIFLNAGEMMALHVESSPGQTTEEQKIADAAWNRLFEPLDGLPGDCNPKAVNIPAGEMELREKYGVYSAKTRDWAERWRLRYRERGAEFWNQFPKDNRRWAWLIRTISRDGDVGYWSDIAQYAEDAGQHHGSSINTLRDEHSVAAWETSYVGMRAEFMASPVIPEVAKTWFRMIEFVRKADLLTNAQWRSDKKTDKVSEALADMAIDYLDFASDYRDANIQFAPDIIKEPFKRLEDKGILYKALLTAMKISPNVQVKDYAYSQDIEPAKLEIGKPLPDFVGVRTQKGERIDLEKLRGKVVLIDFWALWCHACIEEMPDLKRIHETYHAQGLETYGVCFCYTSGNPAEIAVKDQEIDGLMSKLGIPWAQCPRKDNSSDPLWRQYSFEGVPHNFLIDKQGNLAARDIFDPAKLAEKIKELLAEPVSKNAG